MNWLDIILALILVASVVSCFRKGLVREIIGLVSVIVALFLGIWFYGSAGAFLLPYVSSPRMASFAGFVLVFCGVLLTGGLVSYALGKFLRVTGLSIVDHALGAAFGMVRGTVIAAALVMGILAFSSGDKPPGPILHSRLAPYVVGAARVFASMAPRDLREGFRKSYEQVMAAWGRAVDKGIRSGPNGDKKANERQI
jgi:membrane protein required for colicin V production